MCEFTYRPHTIFNPDLLTGTQLEHYVKSQFPSLNKAGAGVWVATTWPFLHTDSLGLPRSLTHLDCARRPSDIQ